MSLSSPQEISARDAQARLRSQTLFDSPYVLEAGAGTGKTATLTARILAWALGPGWLRAQKRQNEPKDPAVAADVMDRILAVTFTEKAAAEMAQRLNEALTQLERGQLPVGLLEEALPQNRAVWSTRARTLLGASDRIRISTLHSFCARLLKEHPLEAGVHPQMEVDAESSAVETETRRLLEERLPSLYREGSKSRKGSESRKGFANPLLFLASQGVGPIQIQEALVELAQEWVAVKDLEKNYFPPETIGHIRQEILQSMESFLASGGQALSVVKSTKTANALSGIVSIKALVENLSTPKSLHTLMCQIPELGFENIIKKLGEWKQGKFLAGEKKVLGAMDQKAFSQNAAALHEPLGHLQKIDPLFLENALEVIAPLYQALMERLTFKGIVSFRGLIRKAADLLTQHGEVAHDLRAHLDQILVDEFQDTSREQCRLLKALALSGPKKSRPGLFLVGDPKQSIYGWRNAELTAYEEFKKKALLKRDYLGTLNVNFRSVPPILEEVQRVMEPVMQKEPGLQPPFETLIPCPQKKKADLFDRGGRRPVEHWFTAPLDEEGLLDLNTAKGKATELEAQALAADLLTLHQEGVPYGDVALLLRSTSEIETYLEALRKASVPFVVTASKSYYRRKEIIDAALLVRCLLDPTDTLAFTGFLRSSTVGVPDAALIPLWCQHLPKLAVTLHGQQEAQSKKICALVLAAEKQTPKNIFDLKDSSLWTHRLIDALEGIATLRQAYKQEPSDRFVELLRRRFLMEPIEASRYLGEYRAANLELFFRDLEATIEENHGDAAATLRGLRQAVSKQTEAAEASPPNDGRDAVQVMTIHKAKGLDFSHVYVLQTHKGSKNDTLPTNDVAQIPPASSSPPPSSSPSKETTELCLFGVPSWGYLDKIRSRSEVRKRELIRTLYVALTRAKDRLVVMGCPLKPHTASPLKKQTDACLPPLELILHTKGQYAELLTFRQPPFPLENLVEKEAPWTHIDHDGVRFCVPARGENALKHTTSATTPAFDEAHTRLFETLKKNSKDLVRWAKRSQLRMDRPLHLAVTALTHATSKQEKTKNAKQPSNDAPTKDQSQPKDQSQQKNQKNQSQVATAVGTAVHRALELWDFGADPQKELKRHTESLSSYLPKSLSPNLSQQGENQTRLLLNTLASGPLMKKLQILAPHVVARELEILMPPPKDHDPQPVGFVVGNVDLVYMDPNTQEVVVVDYKTDALKDTETIEELAASYIPQIQLYSRAVAEALKRPQPARAELWFLRQEKIYTVE